MLISQREMGHTLAHRDTDGCGKATMVWQRICCIRSQVMAVLHGAVEASAAGNTSASIASGPRFAHRAGGVVARIAKLKFTL